MSESEIHHRSSRRLHKNFMKSLLGRNRETMFVPATPTRTQVPAPPPPPPANGVVTPSTSGVAPPPYYPPAPVVPQMYPRQEPLPPPAIGWTTQDGTQYGWSTAPLSVDTNGHGETAGSGYDHLSRGAPSNQYPPNTAQDAFCFRRKQMESQMRVLSSISSAVEEKKLRVKELENDIRELNQYQLTEFRNELSTCEAEVEREIESIESELRELRSRSPSVVPPEVPARPPARQSTPEWKCPRCTMANHRDLFRCEACQLPRLMVPPEDRARCGCPSWSNLSLTPVDGDPDWLLVLPPSTPTTGY